MPRRRQFETDEEHKARLALDARKRVDRAAATDGALDAMVKESIRIYGP